mgnify:FL=1
MGQILDQLMAMGPQRPWTGGVIDLLYPRMLKLAKIGAGSNSIIREDDNLLSDDFVLHSDNVTELIQAEKLRRWFDEDRYDQIDHAARRLGERLAVRDYWWPVTPYEDRAA